MLFESLLYNKYCGSNAPIFSQKTSAETEVVKLLKTYFTMSVIKSGQVNTFDYESQPCHQLF